MSFGFRSFSHLLQIQTVPRTPAPRENPILFSARPTLEIRPASPRRGRWIWGVVGASLLLGGALRFVNLGGSGFWTDELNHAMAAESYLKDGSVRVPSKGNYVRAFPITWTAAMGFKYFGHSETVGRAPFAAVNVIFIVLGFLFLRRQFSNLIAALFVVVMCFSPFALQLSRELRMYTVAQLLYFATSFAFLIGVENLWKNPIPLGPLSRLEKKLDINIAALVASLVLFRASWYIHDLGLTFGVTALAYVSVLFAWTWATQDFSTAIRSKYGVLLGVGLIGMVVMLLIFEQFIFTHTNRAIRMKAWEKIFNNDQNFYRWFLTREYPALVVLYPIGALHLMKTYGKKGFFVVVSFLPLLAMHSLLFPRKADRYIFYLFPFFVLTGVAFFDLLAQWSRQSIRAGMLKAPRRRMLAIVLLLPILAATAHPWMANSFRVPFQSRFPDWKSIPLSVREEVAAGHAVTLNPKEFTYYFGRWPDRYKVTEKHFFNTEPGFFNDLLDLKAATAPSNSYFVAPRWSFNNEVLMVDSMRTHVLATMEPVNHGGDSRLLIFKKKI